MMVKLYLFKPLAPWNLCKLSSLLETSVDGHSCVVALGNVAYVVCDV